MSETGRDIELFVYYRLRADQAGAALAAFEAARAGLGAEAPRLLQRRDPDPSLLTWMEIYPAALASAEPALAAAMAPFVQGLRQCEAFEPLATRP